MYIHTNNIFFAVFYCGVVGPLVIGGIAGIFGSANEVTFITNFFIIINDRVEYYVVSWVSHCVGCT